MMSFRSSVRRSGSGAPGRLKRTLCIFPLVPAFTSVTTPTMYDARARTAVSRQDCATPWLTRSA